MKLTKIETLLVLLLIELVDNKGLLKTAEFSQEKAACNALANKAERAMVRLMDKLQQR